MSLDTFVVFGNQYNTESDALADCNAVRKLYTDLGIIDTHDAAVLTSGRDGKVQIVKRGVEEPTRRRTAVGLLVGLAVSAIVTLFPAAGSAWPQDWPGPILHLGQSPKMCLAFVRRRSNI